eukprot:2695185-Pleurochrysis_carterae.AAC.1
MQSTGMPSARMRSARPPAFRIGPEKSMRTRLERQGEGAVTGGRPGGWLPSSMPELATGGAS